MGNLEGFHDLLRATWQGCQNTTTGTQESCTLPFFWLLTVVNVKLHLNVKTSSMAGKEKPDRNVCVLHVGDPFPESESVWPAPIAPTREDWKFGLNNSSALDFSSETLICDLHCRKKEETRRGMLETSCSTTTNTPSVWTKQFCSFPCRKCYCFKYQTKKALASRYSPHKINSFLKRNLGIW